MPVRKFSLFSIIKLPVASETSITTSRKLFSCSTSFLPPLPRLLQSSNSLRRKAYSLNSVVSIWKLTICCHTGHFKGPCCYCCWVASVVSDSVRPHRQQPTRLPCPGILQSRTLAWVAISFSNAWKWKVKVKSLSRVRLSDSMDCSPPGSSAHGIFQARVLEWVAIAFSRKDLAKGKLKVRVWLDKGCPQWKEEI